MPTKEEYWANIEESRRKSRLYAAKRRAEKPEAHRAYNNKYRVENREKRQAATKKWADSKPGYWLFKNAQYRAKRDGLPFNITFEDIKIPEVCPVLGIPIFFSKDKRKGFQPNSPSIDKIIPALGYVKGNICVISNRANTIKRDATAEELRKVADYIERETMPDQETLNTFIRDEVLPLAKKTVAIYEFKGPP
jgi:hypothetical protein